jgi:dienelactone hydrolase
VVALYPSCVSPRPDWSAAAQERLTNLYDDVDTPTLILVGEADQDTPSVGINCARAAERLRSAGRPVEVRLYPGAGHAFDHGPTFHAAAAKDAETTAVAFLDRHLGVRR